MSFSKKPITEVPETRICHYSNSRVRGLIDIVGILMSSLLLISSIIVLYFVSNPLERLWLIAGFTACFSICLALITDARRVEIFVASSAYVNCPLLRTALTSPQLWSCPGGLCEHQL